MSDKRPNLLIIQTDQQSWWTLGCYGDTVSSLSRQVVEHHVAVQSPAVAWLA